jgi:TPR repeat protein
MLDQNDIGAARSVYRRLAYQKSTLGTLRLAQSYDPAFLSQFRTANVLDDLEQARRWYRRAVDLGADEASQRLTALDAHFD